MTIYTHAIQALETDGAGRKGWVAEPNHAGTGESNGTARQHARRMLNHYLADVAADAELTVGAPGSGPATPVRVVVWDGRMAHLTFTAAAVLYAGVDPPGQVLADTPVTRHGDDSPSPVTGRVVGRIDDDWLLVAWGDEQDKLEPITSLEEFNDLNPVRAQS